MHEARHSSTDVLDSNVWRKPWPHEPGTSGQAQRTDSCCSLPPEWKRSNQYGASNRSVHSKIKRQPWSGSAAGATLIQRMGRTQSQYGFKESFVRIEVSSHPTQTFDDGFIERRSEAPLTPSCP